MKKNLFPHSQQIILLFALFFTLFSNFTFFSKLIEFANIENNNLIIWSVPFVLFAIFVLFLNIVLLLTYKYSFKAIISFIVLVAGISGYFMNSFGTIIDKDMIVNATHTNTFEAFGLITVKLLAYVLFFVIIPIFALYGVKVNYQSYPKEILNKLIIIAISILFIAVSYMLLSKTYSAFFRNHKELRFYTNPTYPIYSLGKFIYLQVATKKTLTPIALDANLTLSNKKRLFVLVVGETARGENFSLNGYDVKTNPLMEDLLQNNQIVNLPNVTSCGTATAVSVPCMFSKFSKDEYNDDKQYYENLVDVVNRVGIKVLWIDNNSGGSQGVAKRIKDVKYLGGGEVLDETMLNELQNEIDKTNNDMLVVLHQEGSHGPTYFKRYPDSFKKFTPTCDTQDLEKCTQQEIVNTYNNTILYTDYFLDKTIKLLVSNDEKYKTALIYMSDHGESLGENGIYLHGLPYVLAPDTQTRIPAILWFGKDLQKEKINLQMKKTAHYSHDNLFHTTLGFFGIKTKEYKKELDILNLN